MDESSQSQSAKKQGSLRSMLALIAQCMLLAVVIFGDIGFDHAGRYGLDFGDFIAIGIAYAIALLFGLVCSVVERSWTTAILQIVIPIAAFTYEIRPPARYDAAAYQYLRGKSKSEVENVLGTRGVVHFIEGDAQGQRECAAYRGLTVIYSTEGHVTGIDPNSR